MAGIESFSASPLPAFADPVLDAQRVYRAVMEAMARPGRRLRLDRLPQPPAPLAPVGAAVALTLLDRDTRVWLDAPLAGAQAVRAWLTFHTGASMTGDLADAAFAVIANPAEVPPFSAFATGSDRYPDRSTTLILQVEAFDDEGPKLSGPGIASAARLGFHPRPAHFWDEIRHNADLFPRGLDVILAGSEEVAALPRSVRPGES